MQGLLYLDGFCFWIWTYFTDNKYQTFFSFCTNNPKGSYSICCLTRFWNCPIIGFLILQKVMEGRWSPSDQTGLVVVVLVEPRIPHVPITRHATTANVSPRTWLAKFTRSVQWPRILLAAKRDAKQAICKLLKIGRFLLLQVVRSLDRPKIFNVWKTSQTSNIFYISIKEVNARL